MGKFKNILCPVDFSEYSELALRYAAAFAEENHGRLIVYHSMPVMGVISSFPPAPVVNERIWHVELEKSLEQLVAPYRNRKFELETRLESGDPAVQIIRTTEQEEIDLIVMGTHGKSGYEVLIMGLVTNKVLHNAKVPVLTVCKPTRAVLSGDPDEPLLIGKILCAIDPVHVSLGTLREALFLARSHHATLKILTVEQSEKEKIAARDLEDLVCAKNEKDCKVEFSHVEGDPVEEILKTISRDEIDLAVMGHHTNVIRPFEVLGSVTLRVIPRSDCAILVIRD